MKKKNLPLLIALFVLFLSSCTKKEVIPTTMVVDTTTIDLGSMSSITDVRTYRIPMKKTGDGTLAWAAASDKKWLTLNHTTGILVSDTLILSVDPKNLEYGDNTATISITPTIDNVLSTPSNIIVNLKSAISKNITAYTLTSDETWNGSLNILGDVTVPAGKTLTIKPGTMIKMAIDKSLIINGGLIMNGNANNIIRIQSANTISPSEADWYGIEFSGTKFECSYTAISDASYGIFLHSNNAITKSTPIIIDHCYFNNNDYAVTDFSKNAAVQYTNNTSSKSYTLDYYHVGYGKAVTMSNSIINSDSYTYIYLQKGSATTANTIDITNSNFVGSTYVAPIYRSTSTPPVNNTIKVSGCYGLLASDGFAKDSLNNILTVSSISAFALKNIGCGYTNPNVSASNNNTHTSFIRPRRTSFNALKEKLR